MVFLITLIFLYLAELPPARETLAAEPQIQQQLKSQPLQKTRDMKVEIKATNPNKISIIAGGKEVSVILIGSNLGQITSILPILQNKPVRDVAAFLKPPAATSRQVTVMARSTAPLGIYQFRVVAAQQTMDLPLKMISLEVVRPQASQAARQQLPQAVASRDAKTPIQVAPGSQQTQPLRQGDIRTAPIASAPQAGRDMPNPQAGKLQQVLPGAQGRDLGSIRPQITAAGPLQQPGSLRGDLAAFERAVQDALWRLMTGCAAPANGRVYTAQEAAACSARPGNDRMATAQQARSDLATAIGLYGGLSLEQSAALLRGIPAPHRSSTGAILFPTKDEIQSYLLSKQREAQNETDRGSGLTKQKANSLITLLGKAIELVGKVSGSDVLEATGKEIQGAAPGLSEAGDRYRKGSTGGTRGGLLGEVMKDVDETSTRTQDMDSSPTPLSAEQCQKICDNSRSTVSDRKKCGCYDPKQAVMHPTGPSGSGPKRQVSDVNPMEVIKGSVQPVINPVPDEGSQGLPPRPIPRPVDAAPPGGK